MILYLRRLAVLGTAEALKWVDLTGNVTTLLTIRKLYSLLLCKKRAGVYCYIENFSRWPLNYRVT